MAVVKIGEQILVNAVCLYMAEQKQLPPEAIQVELMWDEELGFSAQIFFNGRNQYLVESSIIEAIRFLLQQNGWDPYSASIRLDLDENEGIVAYIQ